MAEPEPAVSRRVFRDISPSRRPVMT